MKHMLHSSKGWIVNIAEKPYVYDDVLYYRPPDPIACTPEKSTRNSPSIRDTQRQPHNDDK